MRDLMEQVSVRDIQDVILKWYDIDTHCDACGESPCHCPFDD